MFRVPSLTFQLQNDVLKKKKGIPCGSLLFYFVVFALKCILRIWLPIFLARSLSHDERVNLASFLQFLPRELKFNRMTIFWPSIVYMETDERQADLVFVFEGFHYICDSCVQRSVWIKRKADGLIFLETGFLKISNEVFFSVKSVKATWGFMGFLF